MPEALALDHKSHGGSTRNEFNQRCSLFLGYRHLDVDYWDGGFLFDTGMNGTLLGFSN